MNRPLIDMVAKIRVKNVQIMRTRYVFASEAKIFFANGLKMSDDISPSNMASRILISHILDGAFLASNQNTNHMCTANCGMIVRMLIGPYGKQDAPSLRNSMSSEVLDVVDDFELLLDACLGYTQGQTKIKSIGIRFLPCTKILEIIETVIYLE